VGISQLGFRAFASFKSAFRPAFSFGPAPREMGHDTRGIITIDGRRLQLAWRRAPENEQVTWRVDRRP
jgi:hypothetical protein